MFINKKYNMHIFFYLYLQQKIESLALESHQKESLLIVYNIYFIKIFLRFSIRYVQIFYFI
jgi:hypothetical protein